MISWNAKVGTIAIVVSSFLIQPLTAIAQIVSEREEAARSVTVRIYRDKLLNSAEGEADVVFAGSGVTIAREDDIYYVLTAKHVVELDDRYEIVTDDDRDHEVTQIFRSNVFDLAVLAFTSDRDYPVARISTSMLHDRDFLSVSGWRRDLEPQYSYQDGDVSSLEPASELVEEGYTLSYTAKAYNGMSGGPLFDSQECLVGIHGRARLWGSGGFIGIPIDLFLDNPPSILNPLVPLVMPLGCFTLER